MLKVAIILGSTRPNRNGEAVAHWVFDNAKHEGVDFELIDLAEVDLPFLDEAIPPSQGKYQHEHTKAWARVVDSFDAFIFVTPEYNHSTSGALKNAIDFVYREWNDKACGFVSYGSAGGVRAVEHLRLIAAEIQMADVRQQVMFSLDEDFENYSVFKPRPFHAKSLAKLVEQLVRWGTALREVRTGERAAAAQEAAPAPH